MNRKIESKDIYTFLLNLKSYFPPKPSKITNNHSIFKDKNLSYTKYSNMFKDRQDD